MTLGGFDADSDRPVADGDAAYTLLTFDGVIGFLDLAGFTAATERLGELGPIGTEQLRGVINALFGSAIAQIHAVGGEVAWFAGDALGVVFDLETTPAEAAIAALTAARDAITSMGPIATDAGQLTMSVKVGAAAGQVHWHTAGGEQHLTWFGGGPVDLASEAEHHAEPGDVVLHASLFDKVPEFAGEPVGNAMTRLTSNPATVATIDDRPFSALCSLRRQPARVARLAAANQAGFLDEHRPVTSLFMGLPDATHDQEQLARIRAAVDDLGGLVQQATEGDKGAVVLVLFGAPTALADRHLRAVLAAERLLELVPSARIGVASGRVFAGRVGSEERWDYSVIGDRVNVAARLMQSASAGETLVDGPTQIGAGAAVRFEPLEPLVLKGKAEPELAARVLGVRDSSADFTATSGKAFVGRAAETADLLARLEHPGITLVHAEAGAGKTRLLQHVVEVASDISPGVVTIDQTDRGVPYSLWQRLLAMLSGVTARDFVGSLPEPFASDGRLPLLASMMGQPMPDNAFTSLLGADDRSEILDSLIMQLLTSFADRSQLRAVVVEDLHWIDDGSLAMLNRLSGRLESLGLVLMASTRPSAALSALGSRPSVTSIELPPIDAVGIAELTDLLWTERFGVAPTHAMRAEVVERCAGSPLFCEQLVAHARQQGVAPGAESFPDAVSVPTTLVDLVLARLDRLPEAALAAASFGAIFGRSFSADEVRGAFGARNDAQHLDGGLEILRDQDVIAGLDRFTFQHSLFAETAHDRMSFGLRSELHLDALVYLERSHRADLEAHAPTLARHAESAPDADRKRRYFRMAADQAAERYANDASLYWFRQLVPLLDGPERASVHLQLGEIEYVAGDLGEAERNFIHAVKDLGDDQVTAAELGLARTLAQQGSSRAAFDVMENALEREESAANWLTVHTVLFAKADLATMLGDIERAEEVERRHEHLVAEFGEDHDAGRPISSLIPLLWLRGELDAAAVAYEAYYEELVAANDLATAGRLAADLAGLNMEINDADGALRWLDTACELMEGIGTQRSLIELVHCNEAQLRLEIGDHEGAIRGALAALDMAADQAMLRPIAFLLNLLAGLLSGAPRIPMVRRAVVLAHGVADLTVLEDSMALLASFTTERSLTGVSQLSSSVSLDDDSSSAEQPSTLGAAEPDKSRSLSRAVGGMLTTIDRLPELSQWRAKSNRIIQRYP